MISAQLIKLIPHAKASFSFSKHQLKLFPLLITAICLVKFIKCKQKKRSSVNLFKHSFGRTNPSIWILSVTCFCACMLWTVSNSFTSDFSSIAVYTNCGCILSYAESQRDYSDVTRDIELLGCLLSSFFLKDPELSFYPYLSYLFVTP